MALCLRYAASRADAEDIVQEGYVRVFRDMHQFNGSGPFEGWMRRVFVRSALQFIQKQRAGLQFVEFQDHETEAVQPAEPFTMDESVAKNLLRILGELPTGFRTIFNLYVLEGYSHPEIAEILGISVGTSKSQLMRAKAHFRKLLENSLTN